jgi:hypothetical protein
MKRSLESRIRSLERLAGTTLHTEQQLQEEIPELYSELLGNGETFSSWTKFEDYLIRKYPEACCSNYVPAKANKKKPESKTEAELKAEIEVLFRNFTHDTARQRGIRT